MYVCRRVRVDMIIGLLIVVSLISNLFLITPVAGVKRIAASVCALCVCPRE